MSSKKIEFTYENFCKALEVLESVKDPQIAFNIVQQSLKATFEDDVKEEKINTEHERMTSKVEPRLIELRQYKYAKCPAHVLKKNKKPELKKMCKEAGISGYSRLRKDEIIELLQENEFKNYRLQYVEHFCGIDIYNKSKEEINDLLKEIKNHKKHNEKELYIKRSLETIKNFATDNAHLSLLCPGIHIKIFKLIQEIKDEINSKEQIKTFKKYSHLILRYNFAV